MKYSSEQESWLKRRSQQPAWMNTDYYVRLFLMYGIPFEEVYPYAEKILAYEEQLRQIEKETANVTQNEFVRIYGLGRRTDPYVTAKEWTSLFTKYTDGIYTGPQPIYNFLRSTSIIKKLFDDKYVGKTGLQYLVAWSIYRQLAEFTDPYMFLGARKVDEACLVHVKNVMNFAILSNFIEFVRPAMLDEVRHMVFRVKAVFSEALNSSSWLTSTFRTRFMNTLDGIKVLIGSPGDRIKPEFVERFYEPLHDVPVDRLFPSWIQGRRLNTHYQWKEQKSWLYNEQSARAFFTGSTVVIPTGHVHQPIFYEYGPPALNYAGIGM
ncbi:hypothetical protein MRX96_048574, partial [Rhipicephalus microplus]